MENTATCHTSEGKTKQGGLMGLICLILNWSIEEYTEMQYETGISYLACYIPGDQAGADMLIRSKIFWSWWCNHWAGRDRAFYESGVEGLTLQERHLIYMAVHDPQVLASSIYPGRIILDTSYGEMIGRLFDSEITRGC